MTCGGRSRRLNILKLIANNKHCDYIGVNCRGGIGFDRHLKRLQREKMVVITRENISALPHIRTTVARLTAKGRNFLK